MFLKSGSVCAFRGCGRSLIELGEEGDSDAIIGEMAHIVADSRQGPRGDEPLDESERNKHTNLILVCPDHHTIIDKQPRTYSVAVLWQMKAGHEERIATLAKKPVAKPKPQLKNERIQSTLLPITHLPQAVFAAPCAFLQNEESEVKKRIAYPQRKNENAPYELCPFILRDGKLLAFHNLRQPGNPFSSVIDNNKVEVKRTMEMWQDAEGKRRCVTLLNRSLYKYTARLGVRYDPDHTRFYFPVEEKGKERSAWYRSPNRDRIERLVAWEPKKKSTGEGKGFWWHLAARLRFHQMSDDQWCLSIRPERHLTTDSETPMPPHRIGRRVTSFKAKMYNDLYFKEVVFWRDYLSQGQPRFVLNFGSQSAVVDVQMVALDIEWIGIPGDENEFKNEVYEEDLFTLSEREEAIAGEELDWNEAEEDANEETHDEEAEFVEY